MQNRRGESLARSVSCPDLVASIIDPFPILQDACANRKSLFYRRKLKVGSSVAACFSPHTWHACNAMLQSTGASPADLPQNFFVFWKDCRSRESKRLASNPCPNASWLGYQTLSQNARPEIYALPAVVSAGFLRTPVRRTNGYRKMQCNYM